MKKILFLFLLCASVGFSQTAKTRSALYTEVNANFADNTGGAITPLILRNTVADMIASAYNASTDGSAASLSANNTWTATNSFQALSGTTLSLSSTFSVSGTSTFAQNVTLTAPGTGTSLTVYAVSGQYAIVSQGASVVGSSFGERVYAGSNSSDFTAVWTNYNNSQNYATIRGDGLFAITNGLTVGGALTVNNALVTQTGANANYVWDDTAGTATITNGGLIRWAGAGNGTWNLQQNTGTNFSGTTNWLTVSSAGLTVGSALTVNTTSLLTGNVSLGTSASLLLTATGAGQGVYWGGSSSESVTGNATAHTLTFGTNTSTALTIGSGQAVLAVSPSGGIGYGTGAGGASTQSTSKSTTLTINKVTGQITTSAAALGSGVKVSFTVNDSAIAATDGVNVWIASGGTVNAYRVDCVAAAAGSFDLTLENITGGSLSEAVVIGFAIIKAANS